VLENLHWGDLPSVRLIDDALRDLKQKPLMVLALARPEVHDVFPKLWGSRDLTEIRLKELSAKSSERMVREALGASVSDEMLERIVALADGNAFYLEELIRAVAEGKGGELPPTVLAMVTSRLESLDAEARRVLRAGSVFGEAFWRGGVVALLGGGAVRAAAVDSWLMGLTEREVLIRRPTTRFPGEREYAFRHALLREGAYSMLVEQDRKLGHQLAANWLEQSGEGDAMALAEHFERGGDRGRAARHFLRAAEQAHWGNDAATAVKLAQRGLSDEAPEEVRAALLGLLCEASVWIGNPGAAAEHAESALRIAKPGSAPWARVALLKVGFSLLQNRFEDLVGTLEMVRAVEPEPEAIDATALALWIGTFILDLGGNFPLAQLFHQRLRAVVEPVTAEYPVARGWMYLADTHRLAWAEEDPAAALERGRQARATFLEAGFRRGALEAQCFIGMLLWRLGQHAEAVRELDAGTDQEQGLGITGALRTASLIGVFIDSGELQRAQAIAEALVASLKARGFAPNEGRAHWVLGDVLSAKGDLEGSDREYEAALEMLATVPLDHAAARAMRGGLRLAQGRPQDALTDVTEGLAEITARGAHAYRGDYARLVHAEALHALGDVAGAARAISAARDHIVALANKISDPAIKQTFCEAVHENRRILELAAEWLGPAK
jgi:tetratricopeptide (TPR) repeat protein